MNVKFKRLHEGAVIPEKATAGSAADDLYAPEDVIIKPGRHVIPLGFAMEMEEGYEALVDPRSGFSLKGMEGYHLLEFSASFDMAFSASALALGRLEKSKYDVPKVTKRYISVDPERFDCDVTEGKIDSDYRDEVGVIVHNRDARTFMIKAGTRIAQMTFHKVERVYWEEVEELTRTDRKGGFGHSGTKKIG